MNKLEAMKVFCTVAEEGGFAPAAKVLNVSPTMVSRHIKHLEEHLGCQLFKRNTRKVHLTEAGAQYRQHVKPLLKRLDIIENQLSESGHSPSGKLTISSSVEFGGIYLPKLIQAYKDEYPQVDIDVTLTNVPVDLFDSDIDLVFRIAPSLPNASHIAQPICQSYLSLWASPKYISQNGMPNQLSDLNDHKLLFFKHSIRKDHWIFSTNEHRQAVKLQWYLRSNNGRLLNEAAANHMGIIQAPKYSVSQYVKAGELIEIMPEYRVNPLTISAIYPHRYALSTRVKSFVEFAKAFFVSHPIP